MTAKPYRTEHTLVMAAPARVVYDLVADATAWPAVFGPTVYVRLLEHSERAERFRIWATVNGQVSNWTSRRTKDPEGLRVTFAQEVSRAPIASMSGEWLFKELPDGRTEVVLVHEFTAVDDDPASVDWIHAALDRNSPTELAALARVAELGYPVAELVFSFTDRLEIGNAAEAYAFIEHAELWAERLPHVGRVRLEEPAPGVQELEMDTVTADGSAHTTRSVRICEPKEWIAYKQLLPPKLLLGHSGLWTFEDGPEGPVATATHTVVLNPATIAEVLGPDQGPAEARAYVREALGRNSFTTLSHAAAR